jgi:hypothetical protein
MRRDVLAYRSQEHPGEPAVAARAVDANDNLLPPPHKTLLSGLDVAKEQPLLSYGCNYFAPKLTSGSNQSLAWAVPA